ncbi:MAG: hypothetical protein R6V55_01615, partial [Desulfovermiculus sp.]
MMAIFHSPGTVILFSNVIFQECSALPPANLKYFFAPKRAKKGKFAGLIRYETHKGPVPPSLPGPAPSNTPGAESPGNLVLRLKNIASFFGNRFYFIYKFIKFEYRNPKFETIRTNDLKKQNSKQRKKPNPYITVSY